MIFKLFYRHEVHGEQHTRQAGGILAANHLSFLDPPLIAISTREEIHFLAESYLFENFLLRALILKLNAHPIKGTAVSLDSLKTACRLLNADKKIVVFPEGQRSLDGELGNFETGIGMLALKTKKPVTPVYISGTFEIWDSARFLPRLSGKTLCIFGSAIHPEAFSHLDKKSAQQALAHEVRLAIEGLRLWHQQGAVGHPP
ncbi:MAG: plsC [Chlamydiales bacterium]|nr:plsC [Chlamydiales bacterium]